MILLAIIAGLMTIVAFTFIYLYTQGLQIAHNLDTSAPRPPRRSQYTSPPYYQTFEQPPMGEILTGANVHAIPITKGLEGPLRFYGAAPRNLSRNWERVGILSSVSTSDDTVYSLEQRYVPPFTDESFEYRVVDTYKDIIINLPAQYGKKLRDGDTFVIPGKESLGAFSVTRDSDFQYLMM